MLLHKEFLNLIQPSQYLNFAIGRDKKQVSYILFDNHLVCNVKISTVVWIIISIRYPIRNRMFFYQIAFLSFQ